jgi:hypothetical protein
MRERVVLSLALQKIKSSCALDGRVSIAYHWARLLQEGGTLDSLGVAQDAEKRCQAGLRENTYTYQPIVFLRADLRGANRRKHDRERACARAIVFNANSDVVEFSELDRKLTENFLRRVSVFPFSTPPRLLEDENDRVSILGTLLALSRSCALVLVIV